MQKTKRSIERIASILTLLLALFLFSSFALQAAETLSMQGVLQDSDGVQLASGFYNMRFELYDVASAGTALWTETHDDANSIPVTQGSYAAQLGGISAFPADLFSANPDLWLEIAVDTNLNGTFELDEIFAPRTKFSATPYAHYAKDTDKLDGKNSSDLLDKATYDSDNNSKIDESALPASAITPQQVIRNFVVASGESVSAGDVVVFINDTVRKGSGSPDFGSEFVFNSAETYYSGMSAAALSDTKFVVAYSDDGNFWYGTVVVGDVSGNVITFGSEYVCNSVLTSFMSVAALSETKFVVAYRDEGNSDYGTAVVGDVSGNVIAFGSEYVFNSANSLMLSTAALSETKFVVAYRDGGNSYYGTAVVGDVAGNLIAFGSEYVHNITGTTLSSAVALSETKFVVAYANSGNSNYGTAVVGDVAGNVITFGSEHVFNSAWTDDISAAALSENKFVVAYRNTGDSSYGTALVGNVSDNAIIYGSEYVYNRATTRDISAAPLSSSRFVVASRNGTAVVCRVSGNAIAFGFKHVYNSAVSFSNAAAPLSATKFIIAYSDDGNSKFGTAVAADVGIPLGIADAAASSGQTVPVIIHGISDHHSSLVPGVFYYAQPDGSITETETDTRVGVAISPTELLLDIQR